MRLINADELSAMFYKQCVGDCACCPHETSSTSGCKIIDNAPSVDAVKHGHWEEYLSEGLRWKCSECGSRFETPYHYCPNCGAKMDEVTE